MQGYVAVVHNKIQNFNKLIFYKYFTTGTA